MIVHAHLVCAAVAGGGVECAVAVDRDRASVWQAAFDGHVTISSELPFGATPEVTQPLAPESPEGARWIAPRAFAARDFLPCAVTTVRAELDGDGVVWRGAIELPRDGCAHPRMRARVACEPAIEGQASLGCGPDGESYCVGETTNVLVCELTIARTETTPMRLYARRDDDPPESWDFDGRTTGATFSDDGRPPSGIRFAIATSDGAILWRGRGRAR